LNSGGTNTTKNKQTETTGGKRKASVMIKKYLNRLRVNNSYVKIPSPSSPTSFSFSDDDDSPSDKIRRNNNNNNNKAPSFRWRSSSHTTPSSHGGGSGENSTTEKDDDNGAHRYSSSSSSSSPPPPPPQPPLHSSSSILSELQRAFVYFEIETTTTGETLTTLTRERVKKKYKRLSLIHHPDRNSNGEKSIREMQTINHYYSILEEELDRREEEDDDDEEDNINGENNRDRDNNNNNNTRSSRRSFRRRSLSRRRSSSRRQSTSTKEEEEDMDGEGNRDRDRDNNNNNNNTHSSRRSFRRRSSSCRRSTSRRPNSNTNEGMEDPNRDSSRQQQQRDKEEEEEPKKQRRRRRRNSTERRQRKTEHEKERQNMEQEMKNEWNDNIRKMNEFQKKQRKLRRKNTRQSIEEQLDTVWGRNQAFETYTRKVRVYRNELANSGGTTTSLQEKIKYPLMDCCNEDAIVAMRLGQTGAAVEIIHQEINNASEGWIRLKMRTSTTTVNKYAGVYQSTSKRGFSVNLDQGYYKRILDVLINPIDKERSTILHYAVYLEDHEMISYLAQVAKRYHCFAKFVTYTNTRGMNASQYTAGCTGDSVVPVLMTTLTKDAKSILDGNRQRTIKNQRRRAGNILAHPYADPLFCVFLCLIVGRYATCSGWIASSVITGLSHLMHLTEFDQATIIFKAYFFTLHIGWYLLRGIFFRGWNLIDSIDETFSIPWQLQVIGLVIIPFIVKLRYERSFRLLVQIESSLIFCLNWILSKNTTMFTGYTKHLIDFTILSIPFLVVQQSYWLNHIFSSVISSDGDGDGDGDDDDAHLIIDPEEGMCMLRLVFNT
jgi:curved DNA-binding protein CbpA